MTLYMKFAKSLWDKRIGSFKVIKQGWMVVIKLSAIDQKGLSSELKTEVPFALTQL